MLHSPNKNNIPLVMQSLSKVNHQQNDKAGIDTDELKEINTETGIKPIIINNSDYNKVNNFHINLNNTTPKPITEKKETSQINIFDPNIIEKTIEIKNQLEGKSFDQFNDGYNFDYEEDNMQEELHEVPIIRKESDFLIKRKRTIHANPLTPQLEKRISGPVINFTIPSDKNEKEDIESERTEPRFYNKNNIESGRIYFKKRFMINMLKEHNYQQFTTNKNEKNVCITFESDDKVVLRYKRIYLQRLEKAIFLFNLKKFEDTYQYLRDSQIIKNIEEYAEFLLVTPGLDKYIIGEFLAKIKPPNKDYEVLKAFMQKINFREFKFLDAMRFILSKINLPKDSGLILEIIDKFTVEYFK